MMYEQLMSKERKVVFMLLNCTTGVAAETLMKRVLGKLSIIAG
jgi:hypothetical protein